MHPLAMADEASRGEGACRTRSGGAGALLVRGSADFVLAVGAFAPVPALAEDAPRLALHELVAGASRRIDNHELAVLVLLVGLLLFAVVTAILLLRTRARLQRLETSSHDEIAALRDGLDRANALLLTEPQVMVDWPAGSDEPIIDGDPAIVGAGAPHRVLAFGSWLDAGRATAHGTCRRRVACARRSLSRWRSRRSTAVRSRRWAAPSPDAPCFASRMRAASSASCSIWPGGMRRCCAKSLRCAL